MIVFIVHRYVEYDSSFALMLATLDRDEAERYVAAQPYNPGGYCYEIVELPLHGAGSFSS